METPRSDRYDAIVLGAGFAGLSVAYELALAGQSVAVFESDSEVGGLAGSFPVGGQRLEKFYHHWFTNDLHVLELIEELGSKDEVLLRPSRTGMYYAKSFFRLSGPLDVLKFTPLGLLDRIRLGLLVLKARNVRNWMELEDLTAGEWLRQMGGEKVFRTVWEPMLSGKFGPYADDVSAVWFWNKLKLRGGSRGKGGKEYLAYYRGGFAALAERLQRRLEELGVHFFLREPVEELLIDGGRIRGVRTSHGTIGSDCVVATAPLPVFADLLEEKADPDYVDSLRRIDFLANVCLVLELDRSLSETYWLNIADVNFPYVGIIEHTNFEPKESYGGRHIVYLSKYLPESAELYQKSDPEVLEYSIPYIQQMFPEFDRSWVLDYHVWRARFSQPIVSKGYSKRIPDAQTPIAGLHLCTMAQVYPEDRGTNYAIREGRKLGRQLAAVDPRKAESNG